MTGKLSAISFFPVHIEMMRNSIKIGDGTGFIYHHKKLNENFLITNYHVVSARGPTEPSKLLKGYPDSPDALNFKLLCKDRKTIKSGGIDLIQDSDPQWLEHPKREQGVDIVALKIEFEEDALIISQDKLGLVEDIKLDIGTDLFIVGYPYGIETEGFFPIWKKGSVASEPLTPQNKLARFYIDAFTTPGMSGSPVFACENRQVFDASHDTFNALEKHESGEISALDALDLINLDELKKPYQKKHFKLVGIYSGRMLNGERDPGLGIVWKTELIEEMFEAGIIVKHPYPPHRIE